MKLLNCPLNGPRNICEFSYGGEYHPMPNPEHCEQRQWVEYLFFPDNRAGIVTEWWCHTATSFWFLAERNTITDEIVRTYAVSEVLGTPPGFPAQEQEQER
jgi:sarcosine oxidase subunit delta